MAGGYALLMGSMLLITAGGVNSQPMPHPCAPGLRLSEIASTPGPDDRASWVELANDGDEPTSIAGWCLTDTERTVFVFPDDLPPVPPGGIVLVIFDGPDTQAVDDTDFTDDLLAVLHSRDPQARGAFRWQYAGEVNECALYAAPEPQADRIADYVAWGSVFADSIHRAAAAAAWQGYVPAVEFPAGVAPGSFDYLWGGSVALGPRFDAALLPKLAPNGVDTMRLWNVHDPTCSSPGTANTWPAPVAWRYNTGGRLHSADATLLWCRLQPNMHEVRAATQGREHFQVSRTPTFDDLLVDGFGGRRYSIEPPLPPGKYYWRVRTESEVITSAWSPVIEFEELGPE